MGISGKRKCRNSEKPVSGKRFVEENLDSSISSENTLQEDRECLKDSLGNEEEERKERALELTAVSMADAVDGMFEALKLEMQMEDAVDEVFGGKKDVERVAFLVEMFEEIRRTGFDSQLLPSGAGTWTIRVRSLLGERM